VAGDLLWAWLLTIPCSAFVAAIAWALGRALF
jgi:PiT family inorganic phosphate transporter